MTPMGTTGSKHVVVPNGKRFRDWELPDPLIPTNGFTRERTVVEIYT